MSHEVAQEERLHLWEGRSPARALVPRSAGCSAGRCSLPPAATLSRGRDHMAGSLRVAVPSKLPSSQRAPVLSGISVLFTMRICTLFPLHQCICIKMPSGR